MSAGNAATKPDVTPEDGFTLEDVQGYLKGMYGNCTLPMSLDQFHSPRFDCIPKEVYAALRAQKKAT